ncbi:hypothetical protein EB796_013753 [Bugula neritina]|uniref:Uncharacterized protein n=1 Tax=Bugula neritina TaxID=10212 RepID=A0A7J7JPK9_BUGNE|nr:hypothetical protein EB796_013753 [Bugula neritina]
MSYSYSYKTRSRGGSRMPHTELLDEAEFQNAKMQAMMGAPAPSHDAGSHSYSYKSTNSSSTPRTSTSVGPGSTFPIDPEMEKMKREMDNALKPNLDSGCGSSTYSYSSKSSNSGGTSPRPTLLHVEPVANTGSGSTVKKVVTTTTTKTNPQAVQELEHIQRQFNRIGRTPADYEDDFESLKRDITTGKAYKDGETAQDPLKIRVREERFGNVQPYYGVPLQSGSSNNSNMTTTTTTTRKFGSGQPITEETTTKTSAIGDSK